MSWNYFVKQLIEKSSPESFISINLIECGLKLLYQSIENHTCVAWKLLAAVDFFFFFSTRLFFTQYKKIDKILRWVGIRISPFLNSLLHHCMCVLCVDAIQWIIYLKDATYKTSFLFFRHSLQLFLPVKLAIIFVTETYWITYAF